MANVRKPLTSRFIFIETLTAALMFSPFALAHSNDFEHWLEGQAKASCERLLANTSPRHGAPGAVIASPSQDDPDYYFHWVRDAALTQQVVHALSQESPSLLATLEDYVRFSEKNQDAPTLTGLGEPKFHVDGRPFSDRWGRPQNDGPALRAITLMQANTAHHVIQKDLDYVSARWTDPSYDLWEEVKGLHYYTLAVQKRALRLSQNARYQRAADSIEKAMEDFWDHARQRIVATARREDGIDYKHSGLDAAVLLAFLHAEMPLDSEALLSTIPQLIRSFEHYPINAQNAHLGTALGRYPEDLYYGGNPWVLTTAAVAEHSYKLAGLLKATRRFEITALNKSYYEMVLGENLRPRWVEKTDPLFASTLRHLRSFGDRFLKRIRRHAFPDGSLSEQIDKKTGFMLGARELTWSHAAYLTAFWARCAAEPL